MKKFLYILAVLVVGLSPLSSQREHTVKKGDTLWDLAGFYYGNPFAWVAIWKANVVKIDDPHWIYPGQLFVIPEIPPEEMAEMPRGVYPVEAPPAEKPMEIRIVKPPEPAVSKELILSSGYIETPDKIQDIGAIVGTEPEGQKNLHYYEKVYLNKGEIDGFKKDDIYLIFKYGPEVRSLDGEVLGIFVQPLGKVKILKTTEQGSLGEIVTAYNFINPKDKLQPIKFPEIPYDVKLVPSERKLQGNIVKRTEPEHRVMKPYEIVYIDIGTEQGVKVGDLFEIYRQGKEIADPKTGKMIKMPDIFLGSLQVLNPKSKASTCYLRAVVREDIKIGDWVRLVGEVQSREE